MSIEQPKTKHFVRICQTDLEGKKKLGFALTKIYGVGKNFASAVCHTLGINRNTLTSSLTDDQVKVIENQINTSESMPSWIFNRRKDYDTVKDYHIITSKLKFTNESDIKRLRKIKCYVGVRHSYNLPVRGQRTKSNFRHGKAVGVQKKKQEAGKK